MAGVFWHDQALNGSPQRIYGRTASIREIPDDLIVSLGRADDQRLPSKPNEALRAALQRIRKAIDEGLQSVETKIGA